MFYLINDDNCVVRSSEDYDFLFNFQRFCPFTKIVDESGKVPYHYDLSSYWDELERRYS